MTKKVNSKFQTSQTLIIPSSRLASSHRLVDRSMATSLSASNRFNNSTCPEASCQRCLSVFCSAWAVAAVSACCSHFFCLHAMDGKWRKKRRGNDDGRWECDGKNGVNMEKMSFCVTNEKIQFLMPRRRANGKIARFIFVYAKKKYIFDRVPVFQLALHLLILLHVLADRLHILGLELLQVALDLDDIWVVVVVVVGVVGRSHDWKTTSKEKDARATLSQSILRLNRKNISKSSKPTHNVLTNFQKPL